MSSTGNAAIVFTGVREFDAALKAWTARAEMGGRRAVQKTALALIRQAKINATGPPRLASKGTQGRDPGTGPGVVTGRLRNSIVITGQGPTPGGGYEATVAPTVKYSRRLELGFTGTDSRGRSYNQRPYPYFGPAYHFTVRIVAPQMFRAEWLAAQKL